MRILSRYILFDLTKVITLTLAGLTTLIVLVFVAKEAVEQGLGPVAVARLIPYVLPEAMRFAVPGTLLLAVTSLYGRMAASNELVAIKSLGISPMAVLWPMLILATFVSFGTVWLNDIAVSWGRTGMQRVVVESIEEIIYGQLRSHRTFSTSGMTITVQGVQDKWLIRPTFTRRESDGQSSINARAEKAELVSNVEDGTLTLRFYDGQGGADGWKASLPGSHEYVISLEDLSNKKRSRLSPSTCPLAKISSEIDRQETQMVKTRQEMAAMTAYQLVTGGLPGFSDNGIEKRERALARASATLTKLRAEPHRRWANGFCCLSFALVGAPIAIRRRHSEFLASFFACFLPILGAFYPMLFLGINWAKSGVIPPVAVWTGNVVFALWGVWMLRRMLQR